MYIYEQDYLMRIIHEIIRALLQLLFKIDSTQSMTAPFENENVQTKYTELVELIDQQRINEAENRLFDTLEAGEKEGLELALLFYGYLNNFDNDYLLEAEYSREEIEQGLRTAARMYGYEDFVNTYLSRPE